MFSSFQIIKMSRKSDLNLKKMLIKYEYFEWPTLHIMKEKTQKKKII